jgi:hypothetical protein
LGDDARAERNQDKSAQELRIEFSLQRALFHKLVVGGGWLVVGGWLLKFIGDEDSADYMPYVI